jgi:hypothetical protein
MRHKRTSPKCPKCASAVPFWRTFWRKTTYLCCVNCGAALEPSVSFLKQLGYTSISVIPAMVALHFARPLDSDALTTGLLVGAFVIAVLGSVAMWRQIRFVEVHK